MDSFYKCLHLCNHHSSQDAVLSQTPESSRVLFFTPDNRTTTLASFSIDWCCVFLNIIKMDHTGTSLAVQWLRPWASTAGGAGSIPGQGIKILCASWCGRKKKKGSYRAQSLCLASFRKSYVHKIHLWDHILPLLLQNNLSIYIYNMCMYVFVYVYSYT